MRASDYLGRCALATIASAKVAWSSPGRSLTRLVGGLRTAAWN